MRICRGCKGQMTSEVGTYQYRSLPGTTLIGVMVHRCSDCGSEDVTIPAPGQLNRLIAESLVNAPARLSGPEVRFLRKYLGWCAEDMADAVGLTVAQVRDWEGGQVPDSPVEVLFRFLAATMDPVEDYEEQDQQRVQRQLERSMMKALHRAATTHRGEPKPPSWRLSHHTWQRAEATV